MTAITAPFAYNEQRKARREQKRADIASQRRAEVENARSRRQAIAAARRSNAATTAQGVAQGVSEGSSVQGALGSLTTQVASNIGDSQSLEGLNTFTSNRQRSANNSLNRANSYNQLGQLVNSFVIPS